MNMAKPLRVQPVFMYQLPVRKEQASWKSWGGVQTEEAVAEELTRIDKELSAMVSNAEFPLQLLPIAKVSSVQDASLLNAERSDVILIYACTGGGDLLRSCLRQARDTLIFVRHRSGPVYYWYEALSVKYLETTPQESSHKPSPSGGVHVDDVVVDDYEELLWRLRALSGVRNLRGTRVVALGGAWGKYSPDAPQHARDKFGLELIDVGYDELAERIRKARADRDLVAATEKWVDEYLALPGTTLRTERHFVADAFLLYQIFKDLLREHDASTFTVKNCMNTIIPISRTTACLSLSLLNDEGRIAFCESDFVVIPAGILLRHLSGKPVFLHNSTFPHQSLVTCAHCTAPRRMDGRRYEPASILTHYESEYGAAPKVEMPIGQEVTFLDPEYTVARWVGFKGVVRGNPFYAICRSQQDVQIHGKWQKLLNEVRDSHWLMVYGDYLREAGYAARKLGMAWVNVSES
jgi:L-fucose isomerase-like protein